MNEHSNSTSTFSTAAILCMLAADPSPQMSKRLLYILLTVDVAISWANLFLQTQL